jgi:metal-responsive CopG/Arc/MetJ family transcriptional regulator
MKKIGRPRKSERKENISVNLPKYVVDKVNDKLSWKSSRSEWIEGAIKDKLGERGLTLADAPTKALLSVLIHSRDDVSDFIKVALQRELDNIMRQELKELEERTGFTSN